MARWCRRQGISAIGVSFLHGYANPAHEERMRDVLAREHPEAHVSLSSEVWPEYREYERTVTTLVDAFAKGRVSGYVERIGARLAAELGPGVPFQVMKSNGGVISAREVVSHPITTILSGPAAGALGAAFLAAAAGFERVLTMDAGGTSTDVCLVEGGEPGVTTDGAVGRFPVKVPMIDLVTVGTGGGSIAWRAPDGGLKVGPASAGAEPGPMCYGRGGTRPTVTDAQLVLGRIPPHLLGGEVPLSLDLARKGIEALAAELGLTPERTAEGILEIAAWNQANAVEQMSVKRGLDPRDYTLVAFGGSGPAPGRPARRAPGTPGGPDPGVARHGLRVRPPHRRPQERLRPDRGPASRAARPRRSSTATWRGSRRRRPTALAREGVPEPARRLVRLADLRYFGQAWEVTVELPPGAIDAAGAAEIVARFHAAHEKRYGYSYRDDAPGPDRIAAGRRVGEPPGRGRGPDRAADAAAAGGRRRARRARPDGDASRLVRWPGGRVRRVRPRAAPARRSPGRPGDRGGVRRHDRRVPRPARRGRPLRQHGPDPGGGAARPAAADAGRVARASEAAAGSGPARRTPSSSRSSRGRWPRSRRRSRPPSSGPRARR